MAKSPKNFRENEGSKPQKVGKTDKSIYFCIGKTDKI